MFTQSGSVEWTGETLSRIVFLGHWFALTKPVPHCLGQMLCRLPRVVPIDERVPAVCLNHRFLVPSGQQSSSRLLALLGNLVQETIVFERLKHLGFRDFEIPRAASE